MLQGKAFSRALRGNLIVVQALSSLLYEKAFSEEENLSTLSNLKLMLNFYDNGSRISYVTWHLKP